MLIYINKMLGYNRYKNALDCETTHKWKHPWDGILFTGGEDVSPILYGGYEDSGLCMNSVRRDMFELGLLRDARKRGAKLFGICRGAQFLCATHNGSLVQHIDNHAGPMHEVRTRDCDVFSVTSTHHQMCIVPEPMVVEASAIGVETFGAFHEIVEDGIPSVVGIQYDQMTEAFSGDGIFAVQFHPEMMQPNSDGYKWFNKMVRRAYGNEV